MRSSRAKTLLIAVLGFMCAGTLNAAWEFDSIASPNGPTEPNAQSILDVYQTLQRMMERWNAHDLEGYLDYFWKSPDLLAVSDAQQFSGWQELHDTYLRSFHNPDEMGQAAQSRIQIRMIRPDLAQSLNYWTISFLGSKHVIVGIDTTYLQRFDVGWKVISVHSSNTEL
jgi:hypothetical protein